MSKFAGFFGRKAGLFDNTSEPTSATAANTTALPDNPLELDEELFSALGAQIGGDNESLRNLMLDASAKLGELDTIKAAVSKLADPLSKTLRAFEAEKSEKISIQTVLNNTRTAYGKLRNEVAELEKRTAASDKECKALRQELATTQSLLRRPKPPRPRSPSLSPPAAPRPPSWSSASRRRPAKARLYAKKIAGSTNGFPSPISASSRLNPISMPHASGC
jgi:hypothetical protein